jgi:LacI family transcriptional regulator
MFKRLNKRLNLPLYCLAQPAANRDFDPFKIFKRLRQNTLTIFAMKKKTSLKDIATSVGVSTALVSYVLNNRMPGRIRKEVAQRIRDVATKLNYRPNQIARSLKASRTMTIGLIVADIANPFSSGLARVIEDEANRNGYTVIFGSSDESSLKSQKLIETFLNRQVDGLVISSPAGAAEQIESLIGQSVPFVLVDRYFEDIDTNWVTLDNYKAAWDATAYLLSRGGKQIGMINYRSPLQNLRSREKGYRDALAKFNPGQSDAFLEVSIGNDVEEIAVAVRQLLDPEQPVDSILFGSNKIASAAMKYINTLPLDVPKDLSLINFDETEVFDLYHAPLTYLRQPLDEMGRVAMQMLLGSIERKPNQQISLPAELVVRKSTR